MLIQLYALHIYPLGDKKTNLAIRGSLTCSSQSPLIILFFSGYKVVVKAQPIWSTDFSTLLISFYWTDGFFRTKISKFLSIIYVKFIFIIEFSFPNLVILNFQTQICSLGLLKIKKSLVLFFPIREKLGFSYQLTILFL